MRIPSPSSMVRLERQGSSEQKKIYFYIKPQNLLYIFASYVKFNLLERPQVARKIAESRKKPSRDI